jgi:hypothetical protein
MQVLRLVTLLTVSLPLVACASDRFALRRGVVDPLIVPFARPPNRSTYPKSSLNPQSQIEHARYRIHTDRMHPIGNRSGGSKRIGWGWARGKLTPQFRCGGGGGSTGGVDEDWSGRVEQLAAQAWRWCHGGHLGAALMRRRLREAGQERRKETARRDKKNSAS